MSIRKGHSVMDKVIVKMLNIPKLDVHLYRPFEDNFNINDTIKVMKRCDYAIIKASNKISMDLLFLAREYNIPCLHEYDAVLICRSKIRADIRLRQIFKEYEDELGHIMLPVPESWVVCINTPERFQRFKEWAKDRLPLIFKSHSQHDKNIRFSYLARNMEELEGFYERNKEMLMYAVYVQDEIPCDDIDRKLYVVGDEIYGIRRRSPLSVCLEKDLDHIDVESIEKEEYTVSEDVYKLMRILSKELGLKMFGFDLIKKINENKYYLIDVNDFPGYRGVTDIDNIIANYFKKILNIN
ncbi:MAG: ATP-grasp domain-containing protein [Promethearchaeia archaeon]